MRSNSPTRTAWNGREDSKNQNWNKQLENDNHLPVPLAQLWDILCAGIVDPEADE